jgi:MFS family permease
LDASSHIAIVETSARYEGWRIVVVCFLVATFGWAFGFYGQSVYLAELHRLHGWSASLISAATTFFYLFGAVIVAFVGEAVRAFGPRNCLLGGVVTVAAAAVMIGQVTAPWQLYVANALLAFGWAGTSLAIITTTLGLWFDQKRGMAISLALNGASFGGIIGVPLLVAAIGNFGFSGAMIAAANAMLVVMIPVILILVGPPPNRGGITTGQAAAAADAPSASQLRAQAFRDVAFLTVSIAFALVLFAQVGFIVHLIAFLDPVIGRERAATAVALLTAMADRARIVLNRDRPAQPAAGFGDLVCKSGRGARDRHQFAQRDAAAGSLCAVRLFRRKPDHAAVTDRAARIRLPRLRRADQPDHGDQPDYLCVRPGSHRPAAGRVRKLRSAVLRLHRIGADRGGADYGSGTFIR